ncbi:MAG TPA: type II secretion system F family protein [Acidimicrobiales bacterium]|nr:type II secretion system F family protein [Acidimicrobiales bacterium]
MTDLSGVVLLGGMWGLLLGGVVDRVVWRVGARHVVPVGRLVGIGRGFALRGRRTRARRDADVVEQLPDVVDLLRLTTLAGLPVGRALAAIRDRPGGPVGRAIHEAATQLDRGAATAEVLPHLTAMCGTTLRSFVDALVDHDRYGTPLGPALDRLAVESRLRRRRHSEESARRLPVLLLFPLVLTTLPAFLLLAIVPLMAGSFSSLRL